MLRKRHALLGFTIVDAVVSIGLFSAIDGRSQAERAFAPTPSQHTTVPTRDQGSGEDVPNPIFDEQKKGQRNNERQHRLELDSARLVQLTARLQQEVADSSADTLTPGMLREMDEIEKLARSVKDKMRD